MMEVALLIYSYTPFLDAFKVVFQESSNYKGSSSMTIEASANAEEYGFKLLDSMDLSSAFAKIESNLHSIESRISMEV